MDELHPCGELSTMMETKGRNYKGFIYTVDAIFALIVAAAAISILLFSFYSSNFSSQTPTSEAFAVAQNLLQTTMSQAAHGIFIARAATGAFSSGQYAWPQYGGNPQDSSGTMAQGPLLPLMKFTFNASSAINPVVVAGDGLVVFTTPSNLYALNATSGKVVLNISSSFGAFGPPLIYMHNIYAESIGSGGDNITAYSESGNVLWSRNVFNINKFSILQQQNGFIVENLTYVSPTNGSIVANIVSLHGGSIPAGTSFSSAFSDGETLSYANEPATGTDFVASGVAQNSKALTLLWSRVIGIVAVAPPGPPPAAEGDESVFVLGSNTGIIGTDLAGAVLFTNTTSNMRSGAAMLGKAIYLQNASRLIALNQSGNVIFIENTETNSFNTTPSATPSLVYTLSNNNFEAFSAVTGKPAWNTTIAGLRTNAYVSDIAVAYGNAYFAVANTLYAVGTCSADPNGSLLGTISGFYLNGEGECANLLLASSYNSSKIAMYINNSYAPSLRLARFNGSSTINIPEVGNAPVTADNYSIALWFKANATQPASFSSLVALGSGSNLNYTLYIADSPGTYTNLPQLNFRYIGASNTEHDAALGSNTLESPGKFYSVVLTYGSGALKFYINGAMTAENSSAEPLLIKSENLMLGRPNIPVGVASKAFNGIIADVQIYNTTLNANQVQALYQGGMAAPPITLTSNVLGWWPLEGDTNDYSRYHYGFAQNISFVNGNFTPLALSTAFEVSRASVPLSIEVNNSYRNYDVGIVTWR